MRKTKISLASLAVAGVLLAAAAPAFADTASTSASTTAAGTRAEVKANLQTARVSKGIERANAEIERRISSLNKLAARISGMKKVSDAEKSAISAEVTAEISELSSLKAKIDADKDIETLRADVRSITASYRIYALVIPQGTILAAADRLHTVIDSMSTTGAKVQARITEAQTAGKDVAAMQSAYADFTAKLADAKVQADAAISLVSSLTPDNGDQAKFQANHAALLDARAKIRAGQQDLVAARKDLKTIVQALKALHLNASATTTASSSAQ